MAYPHLGIVFSSRALGLGRASSNTSAIGLTGISGHLRASDVNFYTGRLRFAEVRWRGGFPPRHVEAWACTRNLDRSCRVEGKGPSSDGCNCRTVECYWDFGGGAYPRENPPGVTLQKDFEEAFPLDDSGAMVGLAILRKFQVLMAKDVGGDLRPRLWRMILRH